MYVIVKVDTYGKPFGDVKILGVYGLYRTKEKADDFVAKTPQLYGHRLIVTEIESLEALEESIKKGKF